MMDNKELQNAIIMATRYFTVGINSTTLLGWTQSYDLQGRPLRADPNYQQGKVWIEGEEYHFIKRGWLVKVFSEYTNKFADKDDESFLFEIDLTPDYIKERKEDE